MQYKIPVQIENEDPIFLGLSLKQLAIVVIGGGIGYNVFKALAGSTGPEVAAIPSILIIILSIAIAKFQIAGMTFLKFIYSFIRFKINLEERKWIKGVDSFQPIDIGFISIEDEKQNDKIDTSSKLEKITKLEEQINNL